MAQVSNARYSNHTKTKQEDELVKFSKKLSELLRHKAKKENIPIQDNMQVSLVDLYNYLSMSKNKLSLQTFIESIISTVQTDRKQRYNLFYNGDMLDPVNINITPDNIKSFTIRANQGHTIEGDPEKLLTKIVNPDQYPVCVHGTYKEVKHLIEKSGLSKMARNHIHCAPYEPGSKDIISGMRHDCDLAVYVDMKAAMADGILFYISSNNVILSPGDDTGHIPAKFLTFKDI